MARSSLDIPPVPTNLTEYRSKIWTEVHLLRSDFQMVEMLEAEVGQLREEVDSAKTWAKSFGVFLSLCIAGLETMRRLFPQFKHLTIQNFDYNQENIMAYGKGTYGSTVGRPSEDKKKKIRAEMSKALKTKKKKK